MSVSLLPLPGDQKVSINDLVTTKAHDIADVLAALPYVTLVECRKGGGATKVDYIIVDLEVEVPQHPKVDIRSHEVCAIAIPNGSDSIPDVLALRADFPLVPHLNLRHEEYPRSLCINEDPVSEYGFKWSPIRFIEDIRNWLARTARGELHQPGQPLEPLLEAGSPELIIPNGLLEGCKSGDYFFLNHSVGKTNSVIVSGRVDASEATMFAVCLVGNVQPHGLIRRRPANLAELQEFLSLGGIDTVSACHQALRQYINAGGRTGDRTVMMIVVDLPKARHEGGPEEWRDRLAFITYATVEKLSTSLGVSQKVDGKIGYLIGATVTAGDTTQLEVIPFRRLETLSLENAAAFNGTKGTDAPMLFIGLGALGSHVFLNLIRAGFGRWTLLDRDILLPHNTARHALQGELGEYKAFAMAQMAKNIFPDSQTDPIAGDFLTGRDDEAIVSTAMKKATAIVDCSASVAVGRKLARENEGGRRVSIFLNPTGTDLVLLGESADRTLRLDQLEMMYYRDVLRNGMLAGHLTRGVGSVRYANACRDLSVVLPQDLIALHSGIASHAIKAFIAGDAAQITIWRADEGRNVNRINVPISVPIISPAPSWTIVTDEQLITRLREWRSAKLPNETGGVLLGSFDMARKVIYVADGYPSPSDSKEWPTVYIRGTAGLTKKVNDAEKITQGGFEYVGEWHSHPDGYSANPSGDDLNALATLSRVMWEDARPAVMFIIAASDYEILVSYSSPSSKAQSPRRKRTSRTSQR